MKDIKIAKRYAKAIYEISDERNRIAEIYRILSSVMELYKTDSDFRHFIISPIITIDEKAQILKTIYTDEEEEDFNVLLYIIHKNRIEYIREIVAEYLKIYYQKNRILDIKATFTRQLTEKQKEKLVNILKNKMNREINLEVIVDENILGGGIIKMGDTVIDGSIRKELENWKKSKGL